MDRDFPEINLPPENPSEIEAWRNELVDWRKAKRQAMKYDHSAYNKPEYDWVSSCYSCNMLMAWDETFLDHRTGNYRVDEYLHEGAVQFGGYDAVVLWQAYPRMGFDRRNQFDYYRELPGGLDGLRKMVEQFHRHHVRVFFDYNPWDTGTRREVKSDALAIADIVAATDIDGIFLDTMNRGGIDMRNAVDKARAGVAFESEAALPLDGLALNHLSWAQWFDYGQAPGLLRNRWIEQRHMMHSIRRWDVDHTDELHLAWMNGSGILVWENIFGSWVGWSHENRALLHQMLPIQRHFTRFFSQGTWTPLIRTEAPGVYASTWDLDGAQLVTVTNRTDKAIAGHWINLPRSAGARIIDLISGEPFEVKSHELAPKAIAALLLLPPGGTSAELASYRGRRKLETEKKLTSRLLHPLPVSHAVKAQHRQIPFSVVTVPAGEHEISTHFRVRECGERGYAHLTDSTYPGLHQDVQERRQFKLGKFEFMTQEVTNEEFHEFLSQSGYQPKVKDSFLRHWGGKNPPPEIAKQPVVYVDLNDARAFAKWAGMRLPSEAEWQVAFEMHGLTQSQHPVWNWTDTEYSDGRTRYCLIKGGSWFEAKGSGWYADGGLKQANFAAKFIQIWPGLDRCETLGFRLARDV